MRTFTMTLDEKVAAALRVDQLEYLMTRITADTQTGCWLWNRKPDPAGYARWGRSDNFYQTAVHSVAWQMITGKSVEDGLCFDHLCRVRHCVNPSHLERVSLAENTMRGIGGPTVINAAKFTCIRGHDLSESYVTKRGYRQCRDCYRLRYPANNARRRALYAAASPIERKKWMGR